MLLTSDLKEELERKITHFDVFFMLKKNNYKEKTTFLKMAKKMRNGRKNNLVNEFQNEEKIRNVF